MKKLLWYKKYKERDFFFEIKLIDQLFELLFLCCFAYEDKSVYGMNISTKKWLSFCQRFFVLPKKSDNLVVHFSSIIVNPKSMYNVH